MLERKHRKQMLKIPVSNSFSLANISPFTIKSISPNFPFPVHEPWSGLTSKIAWGL